MAYLSSPPLSPKQIREGFLHSLKEGTIWEREQLILFPVAEKGDSNASSSLTKRAFIAQIEPRNDNCFFLSIDAIKRRQDTVEISSKQILPLTVSRWIPGAVKGSSDSLCVGGFEKQLEQLKEFLVPILCLQKDKIQLFPLPLAPLAIVSGKHGAGKSTLIQTLLSVFEGAPHYVYHHTIFFDALMHRNIHTLQRYLTEALQLARLNQPSIIVLESIDAIVTTDQQGEFTILAEQLSELLADMFSQQSEEKNRIAFIMTAQNGANLHKSLRSSHVAQLLMELTAPAANQRIDILRALAGEKKIRLESKHLDVISKKCEGYMPADIRQFLDRAVHHCSLRYLSSSIDFNSSILMDSVPEIAWQVTFEDLMMALDGFTPASLKGIKFAKSDKTWEDVGALEDVKHLLKETFLWPSKYEKLFAQCPLKLRRGLLLYGPPGCGKTLIASAVAQECNLNFISVKGPELLNKYIGASEQAVSRIGPSDYKTKLQVG